MLDQEAERTDHTIGRTTERASIIFGENQNSVLDLFTLCQVLFKFISFSIHD